MLLGGTVVGPVLGRLDRRRRGHHHAECRSFGFQVSETIPCKIEEREAPLLRFWVVLSNWRPFSVRSIVTLHKIGTIIFLGDFAQFLGEVVQLREVWTERATNRGKLLSTIYDVVVVGGFLRTLYYYV